MARLDLVFKMAKLTGETTDTKGHPVPADVVIAPDPVLGPATADVDRAVPRADADPALVPAVVTAIAVDREARATAKGAILAKEMIIIVRSDQEAVRLMTPYVKKEIALRRNWSNCELC